MKILLNAFQVAVAEQVGLLRYQESRKRNFKPYFAYKDEQESIKFDVNGAGAEIAFSTFLGNPSFIPKVNSFKSADVQNYDVRSSSHQRGRLRILKKDVPNRKYVFLKGELPEYEIMGWIEGSEAKKDDYLEDPGNRGFPSYFVPNERLNQFEERE